MELSKGYIRGLLLYDLKCGESAVASYRRINVAFGEGIGEFNLQDSWGSRRESDVDSDRFRQLVESGPRRTTRELAQDLGMHSATIVGHLHQPG